MRVAVSGATGRTGREVVAAAEERGHDVVALSRTAGETVAGVETVAPDDPADGLSGADVLVDFSVPEASVQYVPAAGDAGVPAVVGTTGFEEDELAILHTTSEHVPVLKATNFARGVQALLGAVREAVASLPGYDVELTETHHSGKRDAPSGTAKTILSEIEEGRAAQPPQTSGGAGEAPQQVNETLDRVYGRKGVHPRGPGEVGVHVRRAGDVRGEHEVLLAGNDEVLTLTHRAESRGVFAKGALDAADWLVGREAGWYEFADVIGETQ